MIYYTLLTDKCPYQEAKNWNELKSMIRNNKLPTGLPPTTSTTFKELIFKCWKTKKLHLPPQQEKQDEIWNNIFQEVSLQGADKAKEIWDKAAQGSEAKSDSIPWEKFSSTFWSAFGGEDKITEPEKNVVRNLLRVTDGPEGEVTFNNFSDFAKTFSPFRTGTAEGKAYIDDIFKLCSEKWFYGSKSRADTEGILNSDIAKKVLRDKKIPFLVRMSTEMGYRFCISYYVQEGAGHKIQHNIITPEKYATKGFLAYLKEEVGKNLPTKWGVVDHHERPFPVLLTPEGTRLKWNAVNRVGGDAPVSSYSSLGRFVT
jgi:hypothetical protein